MQRAEMEAARCVRCCCGSSSETAYMRRITFRGLRKVGWACESTQSRLSLSCLSFRGGFLNSPRMSSPKYRVRRATLDDLGQLMAIWESMKLPAEDLAKRVTEFQVAHDAEGNLLGGLGLQIAQRQGLVHSEAFSDFGLSDHLRPLLWDRVQAVATNHGLLRLWTAEQAPFWSHCGLQKPDPEAMEKLPPQWRGAGGSWLTLKLKDDVEEVISAEKEFALFMESEKQRSQRAIRQAKVLKTIATFIAFGLLVLVAIGAFLVFTKGSALHHR